MSTCPRLARLDETIRFLQTIFRFVTRLEALCLQVGVLGIAALTIATVVLRMSTGTSLLFAGELNRFLIVWVTFLGIGYAAGTGRHIRMTAIHDALRGRARKAMMLTVTALTAAMLLWLAWLSLAHVLGTVRTLGAVSPVLQVPLYLVYLAAPVGLALGAIQYLLAFARNLTSPEVYLAFGMRDEHAPPPVADA